MSTIGDRFVLEEKIMDCWKIMDDLQIYHSQVLTSENERKNYIKSLETIYEAKFQLMWQAFKDCIERKEIS